MRFLFEASQCLKAGYNGTCIQFLHTEAISERPSKDPILSQQHISPRCTQKNSEKEM